MRKVSVLAVEIREVKTSASQVSGLIYYSLENILKKSDRFYIFIEALSHFCDVCDSTAG